MTDGKGLDRKLGDEWSDWDGRASGNASAGKRLFIKLTFLFMVVVSALMLTGWYLVSPRLAQWHASVPVVLLVGLFVLIVLLMLQLSYVVLTLWSGWSLPRPINGLARRLLVSTERRVFALGQRLAIDRDRIAHSLIKINNELVRREDQRAMPGEVLVLLPRCLSKEQIKAARRLAAEHGVHVAVVPGGELARQRIRELRPTAVIGVACERDLVSGLRDVGHHLDVLGIPNNRPHGPCRDTTIDLAQLNQAIEFYLGQMAPTVEHQPS